MSKMLFIVQLSINDMYCNGHVEITKTSYQSIISIRSHHSAKDESNQTYYESLITKNFSTVEFNTSEDMDVNEHKCIITDYPNTFTIIFDNNSHSAYSKFKQLLEDCMDSTNETIYYMSGNISYIGTLIIKENQGIPNGTGAAYYDTRVPMIKYYGEYENGLYDGKGTFYSMDGKITLVCNNISNGIPTQLCKLHFDYNKLSIKNKTIEFDFSEFWKSPEFTKYTKSDKQKFVSNDMFVDNLASHYWNSETKLTEMIFQDKTNEQKQIELWQMMTQLTEDTMISNKNINTINSNINNINKILMYQLFLNIMLFVYMMVS
jgi:hypothetical protein